MQDTRRACFLAAQTRTPKYCGHTFRDQYTRVGPSHEPDAGLGLYAVRDIEADFPLYEYTGQKVSQREADRFPNAYHFSTDVPHIVIDGSHIDNCSPARFVNTKGEYLEPPNNCGFQLHSGKIFLVTFAAVKAGDELFAPYGTEKMAKWPEAFCGCAVTQKEDFVRYLSLIYLLEDVS